MAYKRERRMAHTNNNPNPIRMDDNKAAGLPDSAWNGLETCKNMFRRQKEGLDHSRMVRLENAALETASVH